MRTRRKIRGGSANDDAKLLKASLNNNQSEVLRLIAAGANINATDDNGSTPLMKAARDDYMPMIRFLIENGADMDQKDNDGRTALDYAYTGERDFVQGMFDEERKRRVRKATSDAFKGTTALANLPQRTNLNEVLPDVSKFLDKDPGLPSAVYKAVSTIGRKKAGRRIKKKTKRVYSKA